MATQHNIILYKTQFMTEYTPMIVDDLRYSTVKQALLNKLSHLIESESSSHFSFDNFMSKMRICINGIFVNESIENMDNLVDQLSMIFVAFFDENNFGLNSSSKLSEMNFEKNFVKHFEKNFEKNFEMKPKKIEKDPINPTNLMKTMRMKNKITNKIKTMKGNGLSLRERILKTVKYSDDSNEE